MMIARVRKSGSSLSATFLMIAGDRLGLDAGLGGVVDAARQVAVGRDLDGGREQANGTCQSFRWSWWSVGVCPTRGLATLLRVSGSDGPVPGARDRTPRWGLARVVDDSMRPTLAPGDRLLLELPADAAPGRRRGGPAARRRASRSSGRPSGVRPSWASPAGGCSATTPTQGSTHGSYGAVADDDVLAVVVRRIWPLCAAARCARLDRCLTPPIPTLATRSSTCTWAARWRYARRSAWASRDDLSLAYTPGVARVCEAIAADPALTRHYTWVPNMVAVVTDGTAVLGLGDIGPAAAMPVMEGKAVLFKRSAAWTPSRSASTPPTSRRSSRPSSGWRRRSAASTSRTSRRRAASRSRTGSRSGSTSRSSTTTSTAPRWWRWPRSPTRCG